MIDHRSASRKDTVKAASTWIWLSTGTRNREKPGQRHEHAGAAVAPAAPGDQAADDERSARQAEQEADAVDGLARVEQHGDERPELGGRGGEPEGSPEVRAPVAAREAGDGPGARRADRPGDEITATSPHSGRRTFHPALPAGPRPASANGPPADPSEASLDPCRVLATPSTREDARMLDSTMRLPEVAGHLGTARAGDEGPG